MTQKIKAPNVKGGNGFLWGTIAILAIAAVVIGFVVVNQSNKSKVTQEIPTDQVSFDVKMDVNSVKLAKSDVDKDAPTVTIFEDFSCPHCGDLNALDHDDSEKALNDGKLVLKFNILSFLNPSEESMGTKGAVAALAVAESGNASAFWNLHAFLMQNQNAVRNWDWSDYADAASKAGADQSVVDAIANKSALDSARAKYEANYEDLEKRAGQVATPAVFVDDQRYELKTDPTTGGLKSWVDDVLK